MKRAAIYARYSSDLQNDRSIEDQIVLCRAVAIRGSLNVIGAYEDRAASGASVHGRNGLHQMMADARAKKIDVVLVESLDRLSRDQEDLPAIYKRLTFLGIDIVAAHDGKADQMQVGIRSIVGAMYLTDLAHKTRRGLSAVIRDGRHAGGRAYGYVPVLGKPGELEIVPEEAAIITRIFEEYASGERPRTICRRLNRDGIKPPRGRAWIQSVLNGNAKRGYGILLNEIYVGRIVWNRVRMIKDPDTGRRVSRVNPVDEWVRADAPQLRIITQELWDRAHAVKTHRSHEPFHLAREPRELLSGLLRCPACGGGMSIIDRKRRVRVMCTRHREAHSCANVTGYYLDVIEAAVLSTLQTHLRDRKAVRYYVDVYNAERRDIVTRLKAERARIEMRLGAIEREYTRTRDGFIKGFLTEEEAGEVLPSLRVERARLQAELAAADEPPKVVALHAGVIDSYLAAIDHLQDAIRAGAKEGSGASRDTLRGLLHSVVVHKASHDGKVDVEVIGRLANLIGNNVIAGRLERLSGAPLHNAAPGVPPAWGTLVAGAQHSGTSLPMFRLRSA